MVPSHCGNPKTWENLGKPIGQVQFHHQPLQGSSVLIKDTNRCPTVLCHGCCSNWTGSTVTEVRGTDFDRPQNDRPDPQDLRVMIRVASATFVSCPLRQLVF